MAKITLGFDIGSCTLKIAVLRGGSVQLETVRLPEKLVDENGVTMPNAFSDFLRRTLREHRIPKGAGALVLPQNQVICRLVTLPKMTVDQLEMNLPYEFADFIQGLPEQYFCDYALCQRLENEDEQTMPMMAAVAAKQQLESYIQMFARAGVRLKVLLPQEMALIQLAQSQGKGHDCFFVDLGQQFTRITVVSGDRVQATRQIALGGKYLDQLIADELGVDLFLAASYKAADHQNVLSLPAVAELCDRLAVEILKVVNFYQFTFRGSELAGIYLTGGGAGIAPLREAIAGAVGLPLLDPAELLPGVPEGEGADSVFAAGAAMRRDGK
ncbi:MAG: pilus assembly protein PilM [Oscillospiraceae bacterium]|jgi:type IV pilus assembly protein PilM|nr:pilus assembly protein PilM [Oscillospiraceae bacterium]